MKKQICSVCERKYWAKTVRFDTVVNRKIGEKPIYETKPKTDKCKKHAPPTKTYPKTAEHHFSRDVKRRINRRSLKGLAPKKRKEKDEG